MNTDLATLSYRGYYHIYNVGFSLTSKRIPLDGNQVHTLVVIIWLPSVVGVITAFTMLVSL